MGYPYDKKKVEEMLSALLTTNLSSKEWEALKERKNKYTQEESASKKRMQYNLTFSLIPRLMEKKQILVDPEQISELHALRDGLHLENWDTVKLARVWWLLHYPTTDKNDYLHIFDSLFRSAEVNEKEALFSALPLLPFPEVFRQRTSAGLRTNIRQVFEAIALDNPYPRDYLEEPAWNQMVLKAFFMDIEVGRIVGLDERANETLAHILSDYAHERWAAKRTVNPLLWRPVGKFIEEKIYPDIEKLFQSGDEVEKSAAALACAQSDFSPAKDLLKKHPQLQEDIQKGTLSWENLMD